MTKEDVEGKFIILDKLRPREPPLKSGSDLIQTHTALSAMDTYYNQAIDDAIEAVRKKGENSYRPGSVDVDIPAPYSMIINQLQSLKK